MCIIFNQYFPVFHYIVDNKKRSSVSGIRNLGGLFLLWVYVRKHRELNNDPIKNKKKPSQL